MLLNVDLAAGRLVLEGVLSGAMFSPYVEIRAIDLIPGQPISFQWRLAGYIEEASLPKRIKARFKIGGQYIGEQIGVIATTALAPERGLSAVLNPSQVGFQDQTITITDPNIARSIYRIPPGDATKFLRIQVEVAHDGGEKEFFVNSGKRIRLKREDVNANFWTWRSKSVEAPLWKTNYELVGDFKNQLRHARVTTFTAELCELNVSGSYAQSGSLNPCDYEAKFTERRDQAIEPGAINTIRYTVIQDWKWIIPGAWIVVGPLSQSYIYGVWFYFYDEFGNDYGGFCTERLTRHVQISKQKRLAGAVATANALSAAAFVASIFLIAYAAIPYAVAAAAGYVAKDPPEPDFNFDDDVKVVQRKLPAVLKSGELTVLVATFEFYQTMLRVFDLENARTLVRAKLIGARHKGNDNAIAKQQRAYDAFVENMQSLAKDVLSLTAKVRAELEGDERLSLKAISAGAEDMLENGLSSNQLRELHQDDDSRKLILGLGRACADPRLIEIIKVNGFLVQPLAESVFFFVEEVVKQGDEIRQGEAYVVMEKSHHVSLSSDASDDVDIPPPKRRTVNCC
jgi:hypothetical protein